MQTDWDVKGCAHACTKTGKPFEEGEYFYTLLYREGTDGFRREDLCAEAAWHQHDESAFSYWRSQYVPPAPPTPEALKEDDDETMLRALLVQNDPETANAAYILALVLERKKILIPVESHDSELLVYTRADSSEAIVVRNPALQIDHIPEGMLPRGGLPA